MCSLTWFCRIRFSVTGKYLGKEYPKWNVSQRHGYSKNHVVSEPGKYSYPTRWVLIATHQKYCTCTRVLLLHLYPSQINKNFQIKEKILANLIPCRLDGTWNQKNGGSCIVLQYLGFNKLHRNSFTAITVFLLWEELKQYPFIHSMKRNKFNLKGTKDLVFLYTNICLPS